MFNYYPISILVFCAGFFLISSVFSQASADEDYFNLSLQELAEITIISGISRKAQNTFQSTSASYVISSGDIRRSGMTSIPDLLRMVPGMHVSQLNGNMWAINTRSPNTRFSDELLVMIDGRSVYNTLFNGVYWSRIDTLLEDVERIEVIRGPGSSLWGSNASNGIINIVTKSANDTQGLLLNASAGSNQFDNEFSARYGFSGDNHDSRLYFKQTRLIPSIHPPQDDQSGGLFTPGKTDYDGRQFTQTGFRSDIFISSNQTLTLQGDYYQGEEDVMRIPEQKNTIDTTGHNLLARYQYNISDESAAVLKVYFDYTESKHDFFNDIRETYDIDFQHNFNLPRQEIIWGTGFREIHNRTEHFGRFALNPEKRTDKTTTLFIQDEISLIEEVLSLTIGSKFEKNDYTDHESQPSLKLAYQYDEQTFFWASLAKAVSIPSRTNSNAYLDFNDFNDSCFPAFGFTNDPELGCIIDIGASDLDANILYAKELGYRQHFNNNLSIDNTLFLHDYRPDSVNSPFTADYIWGYEGLLTYQVNDNWNVKASWTYHRGRNITTDKELDTMPRNSGFLSSYYTINDQFDVDLSYYYSGHTKNQDRYHRMDLRLGYRPTKSIELSLTGSNLLDSKHTEGNFDTSRANTAVERAIIGKISYKLD